MSEDGPTSAHERQNGHGGEASDPAALANTVPGDAEVETAHRRTESLILQARVDAEELLSRAHAHAELMRAHAEAARAEAESLRAEAAALRKAAGDEAAAARSRAEALTAQVHAAAAQLGSAMESQADAVRTDIERLRTEAESFRRLLQAETDAALADTQRLRAEVQSLRAVINKLATELHLLSARAKAPAARNGLGVHSPEADGGGRRPDQPEGAHTDAAIGQANGQLDDLRGAIAIEVEQRLAAFGAEPETRLPRRYGGDASSAPEPHVPEVDPREAAEEVVPVSDVGDLLRQIWDAAHAEPNGVSERRLSGEPSSGTSGGSTVEASLGDDPVGSSADRRRATEPLIGSGGWRASTPPTSAAAPLSGPADSEGTAPPPAGRHGRRFRWAR